MRDCESVPDLPHVHIEAHGPVQAALVAHVAPEVEMVSGAATVLLQVVLQSLSRNVEMSFALQRVK